MDRRYPRAIMVRLSKRKQGMAILRSWSTEADCACYEVTETAIDGSAVSELRRKVEAMNDAKGT